MSILTRNPQNQNFLQKTKFQLSIPRITNLVYFCQTVNVPGIKTSPTIQNTPFVDIPRPGDKLYYDSFDMTFIVDEDLWSWELIHDWIRGYTFPTDFDEYRNLKNLSEISKFTKTPQYCEGELIILNALNNPKIKIKFVNLFPIFLSEIPLDTKSGAEQQIISTVSFKFAYYDLIRTI